MKRGLSLDGEIEKYFKQELEFLDYALEKGYRMRQVGEDVYFFDPRKGAYDEEMRCALKDLSVWLSDLSILEEVIYFFRHPKDAILRACYKDLLTRRPSKKPDFPEYIE